MLDKIILGILSMRSLTAYDLKKAMDKTINHFYTTSYGSIHPALVKLEKNGSISAREFIENGRAKKEYSITDSGRALFSDWNRSDIAVSRLKEESMVRIFFFGLLEPENRKEIIKNYLSEIENLISQLKIMQDQFSRIELEEKDRIIADFQLQTLHYGIDHAGFMHNWFSDFLSTGLDKGIKND